MTSYTLLIVESPTLARIIEGFRLPGVEVMATGGFSWQPQWDASKQELKSKADPAWRSFRKQLKQKAPWASRLIIATDSDPAGSFISYAIRRYLKISPVYRTYIHTLSPGGIQQAIDRAEEYDTEGYHELRNRYLIQHTLRKRLRNKLGSNPWAKLILFHLFAEEIPFTRLTGQNFLVRLTEPVFCRHGTNLAVQETDTEPAKAWCKTINPLNTSALLELLKSVEKGLGNSQKDLNKLFTTIPSDLTTGLISYPRTESTGYYADTWDLSYRNWIKLHSAETFLPRALWDILPERTPHESLRPIDTGLKPAEVRPFIRKNLYDIYTVIYNHYFNSISAHSINTANRIIMCSGTRSYHTEVAGELSKVNSLKAMITISQLLDTMNRYGAARPSGFGLLYDALIRDQWISGKGIFVNPGPAFDTTTLSQSFTWESWLEELVILLCDQTVEVSKLTSTLNRMIQELPL